MHDVPAETPAGYPSFSAAEFDARRAGLHRLLADAGADALLAYGTFGQDAEVQYLSNYRVMREALFILPTHGTPVLLVQYFNHVPTARRTSVACDVAWGGEDIAATAAQHLEALGLANRRLAYAGMLPMQRAATLTAALPNATLVDLSPPVRQLRLVKSAEELIYLRRGAALSDRAMAALAEHARPGVTEYELAAIIEGAYVGAGGQTGIHYLATTPMSAPTIGVPLQQQSARTLLAGDILITEISAQSHGYPGQILRPFAIGADPTPSYQRLYDVAVEAFDRIAACLRAGATSDDVLDAADSIARAGYTICDDLLHGLGGGYLSPILRTRQTGLAPTPPFVFVENMTVVIQPNVITPDERSGLQVGELVRITASGIERLHTFPMQFTRCA